MSDTKDFPLGQSRVQGQQPKPDETDNAPLNNFTPRAQQILALARKEADRLNHNFVGTEHLLLGIIKLNMGVAANVLQKLGLDLETVRIEVEKLIGSFDQRMIGNIPYTPRVKKALALAVKEAKQLGHTYVGTEHILLGIIAEGNGPAVQVLKSLEINLDHVRQEVLAELDPNFAIQETAELNKPLQSPISQEKRFRDHPLVQNYLHLIAAVQELKESAIKRMNFDDAAASRDREKQLKSRLDQLYKKLIRDPNYGIHRDEKFTKVCQLIEWPTFACSRPDQVRSITNQLLNSKPVILVGGEGSSRMTLARFIARELFELTGRKNLIGTRLACLDFSALNNFAKKEGFAVTLLSIFDKMSEAGNHLMVVPHLDHFTIPELSSEEAVNAWSQMINTLCIRRTPLLTWTDPDVGLPRLKSTWPGFVDRAEITFLSEPANEYLEHLVKEHLAIAADNNRTELEIGIASAILKARSRWKQKCSLAEPGRTLALIEEVFKRLVEGSTVQQTEPIEDTRTTEIMSREKMAIHFITVKNYENAEAMLKEIRLLKQQPPQLSEPMPKQIVTLKNIEQVLNDIHEC